MQVPSSPAVMRSACPACCPAQAGLLDRGDVTFVRGTNRLASLTVPAGHTLRFDPDKNVTLELRGNLVVQGTLEMKPNPGVRHILRFVGIDEEDFVGGGMKVLNSDVGLWVMGSGKLDIRGEPRAGWNRTGPDTTWKSNDEILTTPFAPGDYTTFAKYTAAPSAHRRTRHRHGTGWPRVHRRRRSTSRGASASRGPDTAERTSSSDPPRLSRSSTRRSATWGLARRRATRKYRRRACLGDTVCTSTCAATASRRFAGRGDGGPRLRLPRLRAAHVARRHARPTASHTT